jgi:hypothetical protein
LAELEHLAMADPTLWRHRKDYNRHDFHHGDSNMTELMATWRTELFGEKATLNDKLVLEKAA